MKLPALVPRSWADLTANFAQLQKFLDVASAPFKYDEANGGADAAIPNTSTWIDLLKADNTTRIGFSITTGGTPEDWFFMATALLHADSANDTILAFGVFDNVGASPGTGIALANAQRLYWGAGALQGYTQVNVQRRITIPANTTRTYRLAAIATSSFGGDYYRGDGSHLSIAAERKA